MATWESANKIKIYTILEINYKSCIWKNALYLYVM